MSRVQATEYKDKCYRKNVYFYVSVVIFYPVAESPALRVHFAELLLYGAKMTCKTTAPLCPGIDAKKRRSPNAVLMSYQRRTRLVNIRTALYLRLVQCPTTSNG